MGKLYGCSIVSAFLLGMAFLCVGGGTRNIIPAILYAAAGICICIGIHASKFQFNSSQEKE